MEEKEVKTKSDPSQSIEDLDAGVGDSGAGRRSLIMEVSRRIRRSLGRQQRAGSAARVNYVPKSRGPCWTYSDGGQSTHSALPGSAGVSS